MNRARRCFWLKLAAGLLFAVVAYGGIYGCIVRCKLIGTVTGEVNGMLRCERYPAYPVIRGVPEKWIGRLFAPAHWADRWLRSGRWISYTEPPRPLDATIFRGPFPND